MQTWRSFQLLILPIFHCKVAGQLANASWRDSPTPVVDLEIRSILGGKTGDSWSRLILACTSGFRPDCGFGSAISTICGLCVKSVSSLPSVKIEKILYMRLCQNSLLACLSWKSRASFWVGAPSFYVVWIHGPDLSTYLYGDTTIMI